MFQEDDFNELGYRPLMVDETADSGSKVRGQSSAVTRATINKAIDKLYHTEIQIEKEPAENNIGEVTTGNQEGIVDIVQLSTQNKESVYSNSSTGSSSNSVSSGEKESLFQR